MPETESHEYAMFSTGAMMKGGCCVNEGHDPEGKLGCLTQGRALLLYTINALSIQLPMGQYDPFV